MNSSRHTFLYGLRRLFFLPILILYFNANAQVIIIPSGNGTNLCVGTFYTLNSISVTENAGSDFGSGTYNVDLVLPANFEFDNTVICFFFVGIHDIFLYLFALGSR